MSGQADAETFRAVLEECRTPDGDRASLIITRHGLIRDGRVWVTFDGSRKTTAVLTDALVAELIRHLAAAKERRSS